jgi:hypothetical protein
LQHFVSSTFWSEPNAAVQGAETAATPLLRLPCNGLLDVTAAVLVRRRP